MNRPLPLATLELVAVLCSGCETDSRGTNLSAMSQPAAEKTPATLKLEQEAEHGSPSKQYKLGQLYDYGAEGVPRDQAEALKWYTLAARRGHAVAQNNLGVMYGEGLGTAKDLVQAKYWYDKAAKHNNSQALHNLGEVYFKGLSVDTNIPKAIVYYKRAANLGYGKAAYQLGEIYRLGSGVPVSFTEAKKWYTVAVHQRVEGAEYALSRAASDEAESRRTCSDGMQDALSETSLSGVYKVVSSDKFQACCENPNLSAADGKGARPDPGRASSPITARRDGHLHLLTSITRGLQIRNSKFSLGESLHF